MTPTAARFLATLRDMGSSAALSLGALGLGLALGVASARAEPAPGDGARDGHWVVQIAAHFAPDVAQREWRRARSAYPELLGAETPAVMRVRDGGFGPRRRTAVSVVKDSRSQAEDLCQALRRAGGACLVARR